MQRSTSALTLFFGASSLLAALTGCREPTATRLRLRTDVSWAPGREVAIFGGALTAPSDAPSAVVTSWTGRDVGDLVFVPADGAHGTVTVRIVMGVTKPVEQCSEAAPDGCIFARRRTSFVEHTVLELPVALYATCAGVACDESTTCNALGRCIPARVEPGACSGEVCELAGDSVPQTRSCAELLRSNPSLRGRDGKYALDVAGPGGPHRVDAYCDMTTLDGGWTLIARSAASPEAPQHWGWGFAAGSVDDDARPYALDLLNAGIPASELLVGSYSERKRWELAYRYALPPRFPEDYATRAFELGPATTVAGTCTPVRDTAVPRNMLWNAGYTANEGYYFFRDLEPMEGFGLHADGWRLAMDNSCDRSSLLGMRQGMIMVR